MVRGRVSVIDADCQLSFSLIQNVMLYIEMPKMKDRAKVIYY